jgi:hypothetical protein
MAANVFAAFTQKLSRYGVLMLVLFLSPFRHTVRELGTHEVLTALRSPWQSHYVERLIGSIRRECLDDVIEMNKASLRRTLRSYLHYYRVLGTYLSLGKDSLEERGSSTTRARRRDRGYAGRQVASSLRTTRSLRRPGAGLLGPRGERWRDIRPCDSALTAFSAEPHP